MRRFLFDSDGSSCEGPEAEAMLSRQILNLLADFSKQRRQWKFIVHHVRKCLRLDICENCFYL